MSTSNKVTLEIWPLCNISVQVEREAKSYSNSGGKQSPPAASSILAIVIKVNIVALGGLASCLLLKRKEEKETNGFPK